MTAHWRENFGEPLREICRAVHTLVESNEDIEALYPLHPNPNVRDVVYEMLGGHVRIRLCPPLDYVLVVAAMWQAYLILADSGGVQEQTLPKPVLVVSRRETERPEAVERGAGRLVCPNFEAVMDEAQRLLSDEGVYRQLARGASPYRDGHAAGRIVGVLKEHFG